MTEKSEMNDHAWHNAFMAGLANGLSVSATTNFESITKMLCKVYQARASCIVWLDTRRKLLVFKPLCVDGENKAFEVSAKGMLFNHILTESGERQFVQINSPLTEFWKTDYVLKTHKFGSLMLAKLGDTGDTPALLAVFDPKVNMPADQVESLLLAVARFAAVELSRYLMASQHDMQQLKYKMVYQHVNDGIFILNAKGLIVDCNPITAELFGSDTASLIGVSPASLSPEYQPDGLTSKEKAHAMIKTAFDEGKTRFYWKHMRQDGTLFDADVSLSKVVQQDETYLIAAVRDTTQQKNTEENLIEARKRAEEADKLKSAFLANMSHEIRTPLNSIIGFSELLIDDEIEPGERAHFLNLISTAGKSLLQLVDDIIDISKIEARQLRISKSMTEINSLLEDLHIAFENEKRKRNKPQLALRMKRPGGDQKIYLNTDPFRLRQIFSNLLLNAIKFADKGFVEFGYNGVDGQTIQFYVKDTGIGIEKDKTQMVFQRFGQVDSAYKRNLDGTGLGLAISKHLVELLGGKIWFDTEPGKGSTFYFTLPTDWDGTDKVLFGRLLNDWSDKVFLVVDDVEANFRFLKAVFRETRALILWAKSGEEAIKICRNNSSINLVLMDIRMPDLDGNATTKAIRDFAPDLPIIAQTAFADEDDRQLALSSGCDDYISKPICRKELASLITQMLA